MCNLTFALLALRVHNLTLLCFTRRFGVFTWNMESNILTEDLQLNLYKIIINIENTLIHLVEPTEIY